MERSAMTVHRARCGSNGKAETQSSDCESLCKSGEV